MLTKHFYNILFCLATLAFTSLQAAHLLQQEEGKNDAQETYIAPKPIAGYYNHTLQNRQIGNIVDPKELAEEQEDLKETHIAEKFKNSKGAIFFMVIVSNKQTAALSKFFFFNRAPNIEQGVVWKVQKAHQCHVISHHKPKLGPHIVFQLLGWLEQEKSQYTPIFIYASSPICVTCNALVESFFNLHVLSNAKGCNGLNSIDLDNTCPLAQQYIKRGLTFPLAKKLLLPTLRLTYEGKIKLLEQTLASQKAQGTKDQLALNILRKDIEAKTQDNTSLKNEVNQLKQNVALANAQATKLLLEKEDLQKEKISWQNKHKSVLQSSRNLAVKKNKQIKSLKSLLKDRIELPCSPIKGHINCVISVAVTTDNRYIVSGSGYPDNTIRIWDIKTGKELSYSPLKGHTYWVKSVALTKDNKYIVSGGNDNTIRIWDLKTGKQLSYSPLKGHTGVVHSVTVTSDNQYIVSGSRDATIRIWDFKTGKQLPYSPLTGHTYWVNSVAVTNDNKYIVSGSGYPEATIRIWDLKTGKQLPFSPLNGHTGTVESVAVTNDNKYIVSGSWDYTIRIWDLKTGKKLPYSPLTGHKNWVCSVAVTSDNQYIVSSGGYQDKTIRIWDIKTGNELPYSPLKGHTWSVRSVAVTTDNQYIVSGSEDNTIRIWDFALLWQLNEEEEKKDNDVDNEVFDID